MAKIHSANTETQTIAELLMIRMDGLDQTTRRKSLKQLLGLTSMACCGATWENEESFPLGPETQPIGPSSHCVRNSPAMNLAEALAAERMGPSPSRPNNNEENNPSDGTVPARMSLMRLLEEADTYYVEMKKEEKKEGCDSVCCVCMGRKKGAAFIPCGHTFCRVCSRELWSNRGTCPLCNRLVVEILDIY